MGLALSQMLSNYNRATVIAGVEHGKKKWLEIRQCHIQHRKTRPFEYRWVIVGN